MIDIHCHLVPGIDDGAPDLEVSLKMARRQIEDGVGTIVCTPHILPGLYNNTGPQIRAAIAALRACLADHGIELQLRTGADVHIVADSLAKLRNGEILTLADSRYVLIELPWHVSPKLIENYFFELIVAGYVPILSHPERLSWIENRYAIIKNLVKSGVWLQLTAGSLLGEFGQTAKYWSERMLLDGIAHVLATDSHSIDQRPPCLGRGRDAAAKLVGFEEAEKLVSGRPRAILCNEPPGECSVAPGLISHADRRSA